MSEIVAVIPARGGSQGVPRKNVRRVAGVPLIGRAVVAARETASIDRVIVSTDDPEIAATAREWGAQVIDRPADLAGHTASSESALLHALEALRAQGVETDILVFLQATSPFIDPDDIDRAIRRVREESFDSVFSAVETYGFLWSTGVDGEAIGINHDASVRPRRQDREPHYLETGAFYALRAAGFSAARHRFFGRVGLVEVAERSAIEIDTAQQLEIATAIARIDGGGGGGASDRTIAATAVVTDFDGVHTDDTATVDADGHETVRVSRSDGMGIAELRRAGIPVLILSTETNAVVSARARKLRVDVRQGVDDKAAVLIRWAAEIGVSLTDIAYVGNDINDLGCLDLVGWPVAVADAQPSVLAAARVVLTRAGGHGAVRELSDLVLRSRGTPRPSDASERQEK